MSPEREHSPKVPVSIHPEVREHTKLFEKKVYRVADVVHVAVGWGMANIVMVEGADGVIIIDTGQHLPHAQAVLAEFRKITQKPVAAVVLTHQHRDHVLGASAFVSPQDAQSGKVPVIAHQSLLAGFLSDVGGITEELQTIRAAHMFGQYLPAEDLKDMNGGIGPGFSGGPSGFVAPNQTFEDSLDVTVAGVRMHLVYVPGEAPTEAAVYLPDHKVLLGADVLAPTYPNIGTLRGARFRDPMEWCRAIDRLRTFDAEALVLHHGPPLQGREAVATVLAQFRDAIQFTHDQALRFMTRGLTPAELSEAVRLPQHLETVSPWLRPFYGTVQDSVRQVYYGLFGWFEGDPVALAPTPRVEYARRLVGLMGGRDRVLDEARKALKAGDPQFAAELTTFLVRVHNGDQEARDLKAAAFRTQGYAQINTNWRNWYLTSAMDLEGTFPSDTYLSRVRGGPGSAQAMAVQPPARQVGSLPIRLKAEEVLDVRMTAEFRYTDVKEVYTVEVRRGVAEVREGAANRPTVALEGDRKALAGLIAHATTVEAAVNTGAVKVTGALAEAERFFGWFERRYAQMPQVTVR